MSDIAADTTHQDTLGGKLFALSIGRLSDASLEEFRQKLEAEQARRAGGATAAPDGAPEEPATLEQCPACLSPGDPTRGHRAGTAQHPETV